MLPEVALIGKMKIDWPTYLASAKSALGRSLTKELDSKNRETDNIAAYIFTLAEIQQPDNNPDQILQNPGHLIDHCFTAFLVVSDQDTINTLLRTTKLNIQSGTCINNLILSVVSGDLGVWRQSIINGCSDLVSFNVRLFFDKCLIALEQEGLGKVFKDYGKKQLPDKTFKLIEKK
jgi:hypothetical protein